MSAPIVSDVVGERPSYVHQRWNRDSVQRIGRRKFSFRGRGVEGQIDKCWRWGRQNVNRPESVALMTLPGVVPYDT